MKVNETPDPCGLANGTAGSTKETPESSRAGDVGTPPLEAGGFIQDAVKPLVNIPKRSPESVAEEWGANLWSTYRAIGGPVLRKSPGESSVGTDGSNDQETVSRNKASADPGAVDAPDRLKLSSIGVSVFNRSYEVVPDENHINDLAASIFEDGLHHAVGLAEDAENKGLYWAIYGANRREALRKKLIRNRFSGGEVMAPEDRPEAAFSWTRACRHRA